MSLGLAETNVKDLSHSKDKEIYSNQIMTWGIT